MSITESQPEIEIDYFSPELSERAFSIFVEVSRKRPASVVAQGALIANIIEPSGENPETLKRALLLDENKLLAIVQAANEHHKSEKSKSVNITLDKAADIVTTDFNWAVDLKYVSSDNRRLLYDHLYRAHRRSSSVFRDEVLGRYANDLIRGRKINLPSLPKL